VIENNIVHDILSRAADDSAAIYLDEGSSYIKCRNNVCYGCDRIVHLHYGYANEISNNLFAYSNTYGFKYSRSYEMESDIANNIHVVMDDDRRLGFFAHENILLFDHGELMNYTDGKGVYLFSTNLLDGNLGIPDSPEFRRRICYQDMHRANITRLVGTKNNCSIIKLTKFGIKTNGTASPTVANSLSLFFSAGKGFHSIDILENPSLCGIPSQMKCNYDSDESNRSNFEQQRYKASVHFSEHSIYFNS